MRTMRTVISSLQTWWKQRTRREQSSLTIAGILLTFFLAYTLLWEPVDAYKENLVTHIHAQQTLLTYMEKTHKKILSLKRKTNTKSFRKKLSLLTAIHQSTQQHMLTEFISALTQHSSGKVNVVFKQAPFSKLLLWLQSIWEEDRITGRTVNLTPAKFPGTVNATLTLSFSNS